MSLSKKDIKKSFKKNLTPKKTKDSLATLGPLSVLDEFSGGNADPGVNSDDEVDEEIDIPDIDDVPSLRPTSRRDPTTMNLAPVIENEDNVHSSQKQGNYFFMFRIKTSMF